MKEWNASTGTRTMGATAHRTNTPMTADAFLDALPRMAPGKHMLVDGVIYSMAPASPTHAVIQANLARLIGNHLIAQRPTCRVMTEAGVKPRVRAKTNVRIPDLTVACGPIARDGDKLVDEPMLTIEVLSPSNDDLTDVSIMACASIPSVKEMLVVDSSRVFAEVWKRSAAGDWPDNPDAFGPGATLSLTSIGLELNIADVYTNTHLAST